MTELYTLIVYSVEMHARLIENKLESQKKIISYHVGEMIIKLNNNLDMMSKTKLLIVMYGTIVELKRRKKLREKIKSKKFSKNNNTE